MKFAMMVVNELRCMHKNYLNLIERIIQYYNADVIIVCQNAFQDDIERIEYLKKYTVHVSIYDKPDPLTYFGENTCLKNIENGWGQWNSFGCLQIYINMMEMNNVITKHNLDYDYYLMFRTDSCILFDLPPIDIFKEAPPSVYGFYSEFWKKIGNHGGQYIHKNYITDYLTAPYTYINDTNNFKILNQKHILTSLNTIYYKDFDKEFNTIPISLYQETLFIVAFESVGINIKKIHNLPFYFSEDINESYVFNNMRKRQTDGDVCYKYPKQYTECNQNLIYWNNGYRWKLINNEIILVPPIPPNHVNDCNTDVKLSIDNNLNI